MEQSAERRHIDVGTLSEGAQEVAPALRQLSDTDLLRLEALARLRARGLPASITWSDLLHEAIRRALDGSRPWPPNLPLLAFLAGIMRSVRSEWCRRNAQERLLVEREFQCVGGPGTDEMDPERVVAAARAVAAIYEVFSRDGPALKVIAGLADGLTAQEIRDRLGMSETEYDTTRKRMRRTLLRRGPMRREP
jgi:DNA-directed RNA polymerase specialized sigma24 family protein